jgi:hypothetical protein
MHLKINVSREISGEQIFGGIGTHVLHMLRSSEENQIFITSKLSQDQMIYGANKTIAFESEDFKNYGNKNKIKNLIFLIWYRFRVALFIYQASQSRQVEVELAEYMFEGIFLVLIPKRIRRNITILTRLHGSSAFDRRTNTMKAKSYRNKIFWLLERIQINRSDQVVAPTYFAKTIFQKYIKPEIEIRSNAFAITNVDKVNSDEITLTYIGSKDLEKGTDIIKKLITYFPNLQFEVLGNLRFNAPNLSSKIIPQHEMAQHLASKRRILLVPSRSETFGYTFLEGLCYSDLVLASDIPVFRELSSLYLASNVLFIEPLDELQWIKTVKEIVYK